jgi:hypothetical protein
MPPCPQSGTPTLRSDKQNGHSTATFESYTVFQWHDLSKKKTVAQDNQDKMQLQNWCPSASPWCHSMVIFELSFAVKAVQIFLLDLENLASDTYYWRISPSICRTPATLKSKFRCEEPAFTSAAHCCMLLKSVTSIWCTCSLSLCLCFSSCRALELLGSLHVAVTLHTKPCA